MTRSATLLRGQTMRILVVDDHPTVREGLAHCIAAQPDMTVCGAAADVGEALREIEEHQPHLVIVDISLKTSDGLDLVKAIVNRHPAVRTVVHSMYDEAIYADRCLRAGAHGYVNKEADPDDVIEAIRTVLAGDIYLSAKMTSRLLGRRFASTTQPTDPVETLTDRQLEIFRLIGEGGDTRSIAQRLHLSVHTVETHRENIKRKLGVERLSDLNRRAVLWAQENR
ncbi:response regulator transcription factor [Botrimarina sp.]|uniref:response regulator transcription factor n=1 Tax=Botrimarina sp. TaxID=2795802 RepID=UPI0032F01632